MKVTASQARAVEFIYANPGATTAEIAQAAGVSTSYSNSADFLRRLVDNGLVHVVPPSDVRAVLEGDGGDLDEPAEALWRFFQETRGA